MPVHRLFAVGLWVVVTASATAIVWAATSTVAADLTDRPAPFVAHSDVVTELESGAPQTETDPGITISAPGAPAPAAPDRSSPAPATRGPEVAAPAAPAASPPAGTPAVPPAVTPTTQPPSPPTTEGPRRPTATYSTAGGVATVACDGFLIQLVSATPNNGYAVNVVSGGPYYVEVHFVGRGQDAPLWAFCLNQPIRAYNGPPVPGGMPRD